MLNITKRNKLFATDDCHDAVFLVFNITSASNELT